MNQIKQKKGLESRTYKIDSNFEYVEVEYKTLKDKLKYRISLTEVGNEIIYEAENPLTSPHRIFGLFFGISSIVSLYVYFFIPRANEATFLLLAILFITLTIISFIQPVKDDVVIINGTKIIRLFRSKPNNEEVLKFANNLIEISNKKKKELLINFNLNEHQFITNINYLLNMKLINETEFEELKSEYELKKLL